MKAFRNPWPFGIVLAFGLFFAGTASLVVIACSHKMDLVSPDYYEQEIRYETHLDRVRRTPAGASITYDAAAQRITIDLSASGRTPSTGSVELYRPSAAALDRRYPMTLDGRGIHILDASNLLPGLWKVRVSWKSAGQEYFTEKSLIVGPS